MDYISEPIEMKPEKGAGRPSSVTGLSPRWVRLGDFFQSPLDTRTAFIPSVQNPGSQSTRKPYLHLVSAEVLIIKTLEPTSKLFGSRLSHAGGQLGNTDYLFAHVNRAVRTECQGQCV